MSPHRLTNAEPHQLAAGVLAHLAGADLDAAAADVGVRPGDLDEAVIVYRAAGLAALERRAEAGRYQLRIQFADPGTAEKVGAHQLGPRLEELHTAGV
ncbi:hypothetical protein AB0K48_11160, partial [Nonomuraea sp. NPDC055795]